MIRKISDSDIEAVKTLYTSQPGLWREEWRVEALERAIATSDGLSFIWEEEGAITGFICGHDCGFQACLSGLVVSPAAQGEGIGARLVAHLQSVLTKRGCAEIIAEIDPKAKFFYRELGWRPGENLLMVKKLL